MKMTNEELMRRAILLAEQSVAEGGGPFGAVIARDGELIAEASNHVVPHCDPTAHAEVSAIRAAAKKLSTFDLSGCEIFSSCEPCPMCLSALYWAGVKEIYYGNTKVDADKIGFGDDFIYRELEKPYSERLIPLHPLMRAEALRAFRAWEEKDDKIAY